MCRTFSGDYFFFFAAVEALTGASNATAMTSSRVSTGTNVMSFRISSVNSAISLKIENDIIIEAHVSTGGVAPIPLYLRKTSEFLRGKEISNEMIAGANEILQTEIAPISDVRGSENYKRLLARQLFTAHFVELFKLNL